ncbi:MAG: HTH domain-containing protein [Marinifilaceae bacterium]
MVTGEKENLDSLYSQYWKENRGLIQELVREFPKAVEVLTFLVKNAGQEDSLVISMEALGEALDISRQTVYRAVNYLKEKHVVNVSKKGNTNAYSLNKSMAVSEEKNVFDICSFLLKTQIRKFRQ